MKPYTDITVLVDRSGSMRSIKSAMESAYEEFLLQHRSVPTTRLTLIQFDRNHMVDSPILDVVYENVPVGEAAAMTLEPRGNTPLLDAVCQSVDRTGKRFGDMPESERPDQVLFVVITDGQENASQEFKLADVRERLARQQDTYKWKFLFLGANQDMFAEAASMGVPMAAAVNFSGSAMAVRGMSPGLALSTLRYANRTATEPRFTAAEREAALDDHDKHKASPSSAPGRPPQEP